MDKKEYSRLIAQMDQSSALLGDTLAPMMWSCYTNFKEQGFTDEQAFDLTKTFMECTFGAKR